MNNSSINNITPSILSGGVFAKKMGANLYIFDISDTGDVSQTVVTTEGGVQRSLQDRFGDIINVKDFGAKGDGITSDQEAFDMAMMSDAKFIFVPDGVYILNGLYIAKEKHLFLSNGATIKRKTWNRSYYSEKGMYEELGIVQSRTGLITFLPGSDGSSFVGGCIDVDFWNNSQYYNINDLEAIANLNPLYDLPICLRANNVNRITIDNVVLKNSGSFAINFVNVNKAKVSNITIDNCALSFQFHQGTYGVYENIKSYKIGNRVRNSNVDSWKTNTEFLIIYQHASVFRYLEGATIRNIVYDGYAPYEGTGTEPYPEVLAFGNIYNSAIENILVKNNINVSGVRSIGFVASGCSDVKFSGVNIYDVVSGIVLNGCVNVVVDKFSIDCNWFKYDTDLSSCSGVAVGNSSWLHFSSNSATDMLMNTNSKNVTLSNGLVKNGYIGVTIKSSDTKCQNVHVMGCNVGFVLREAAVITATGVTFETLDALNNTLVNCEASYCCSSGLIMNDQIDAVIDGCKFYSNGLIASNQGSARCGITIRSNNEYCHVVNCSLYNEEAFTKQNGLSFAPGNVDVITEGTNKFPYRFTFVSPNPTKFKIGQALFIEDLYSGEDLYCFILNILGDRITVGWTESLQSLTPPASSLVAMSGSISCTAGTNTVTGTGTSFKTELTGTTFLKIGNEYKLVQKVISDTNLLVSTTFENSYSGTCYKVYNKVAAYNIQQQYGLFNEASNAHTLFYKNNVEYRNAKTPMYSGQNAICADSEWKATYGVVNFSGASANISPTKNVDIPLYYKFKVLTDCKDSGGNIVTLKLRHNGSGQNVEIATGISGSAGTVVSGIMPNIPWAQDGNLVCVSEGNAVASGTVYGYIKNRRSVPNEYFD